MQLTVEEILKCEFLAEARVIAGSRGLDRRVKYVDVIEVPDIEGWIKQGGLFLTTGYSIRNDREAQSKLVNYLSEAGSAALCIKKGRYFEDIPAIMIELGDKQDLPIIELPKDIPYVDIIIPLLSQILEKQAYLLKRSEKIHEELSRVVLKGGGLDLITQTLYKLIFRPVLIQDKKQNVLALVGKHEEEKLIRENLNISQDKFLSQFSNRGGPQRVSEKENFSRVIAPIIVAGKIYGFVSIFETGNKKLEKLDFRAVEHAATIIALEMLKEKERVETERRIKAELLDDLLEANYSNQAAIIQRARYLNWDFTADYVVFILTINSYRDKKDIDEPGEEIKSIINRELVRLNKDKILVKKGDSLVVFFGCEGQETKQEKKQESLDFARKIKRRITRRLPEIKIVIGMGNHYPGVQGLKRSYEEAVSSLEIGNKVFGDDAVYHYDRMGIFRILSKIKDDPDLINFYRGLLGPLLQKKNSYLLETLRALIKNFGNKTRAAEELKIHRKARGNTGD